jgi:sugar phosphate isomerase/epimerase
VKLSCLPVSYFQGILEGEMTIEQWAGEAAGLGLDAIDLSIVLIKNREAASLEKLRQAIVAHGLRVNMLTTYPDFTQPEAGERERQLLLLKENIDVAAALGAGLVRVTAGQAHPGLTREAGLARAVAGLTGALAYAEQRGVKLVYENHAKPAVWDYYDFSFPPDIFLDIVLATAGSALAINFDTANPVAFGAAPLPLLEQVIDRVISIHAAENRVWGKFEPAVFGAGVVPFVEIFAALKRAHFDGWISIEEASRTGPAGVAQAVSFVRKTWEVKDGI